VIIQAGVLRNKPAELLVPELRNPHAGCSFRASRLTVAQRLYAGKNCVQMIGDNMKKINKKTEQHTTPDPCECLVNAGLVSWVRYNAHE